MTAPSHAWTYLVNQMKKWLVLCASAACTLAFAGTQFTNVPEAMHKPLNNHSLKTAQLDSKGVLRVQINKPVVSQLVYATFIFNGICAEQWRNPTRFATLGLTRVEVFDNSAAQGFAFDPSGNICAQMGEMGKNFGAMIAQRTVPGNAGVCPQRP